VSDAEWKGLVEAIGRPELLDDPRFRTQRDRGAHLKEQHATLQESFALRTTEEWLTVLRKLDAVSGPINTLENLGDDPQIRASEVIWEGDHPAAGTYRQPIHPIDFEDTPAQFLRHAPMLGEHTEEILRELGFQHEEIVQMNEQGAIGGK
jgi:crotonobetainyl-CoA:carnitine CoA-transferase CaiB-like acyl-CoA transferase